MYCELSRFLVVSSMAIERSRLLALIDRCIRRYRRPLSYRPCACTILESWKTQLVLEKIRRNRSAKTIQRQFRESMSNPAYDMCKRRLLREFAEGISV